MAQVDARNLVSADAEQKVEAPERSPSATGPEELIRSFISDQKAQGTARGNVKVLILTAFLFGLITAVQWVFGVRGHSNALLADCHCMLVDALTYFLNIWVELSPERLRTPLRLTVPCISLTVLAVLTGISIQDAVDVFTNKPDDDGNVSALTVWSFGFAGLIFDCICIYAFWRNKKRGALPVNMLAAFMHVGADFIRSLTTTIEGGLLFFMTECAATKCGDLIDAWNTIVIVILIFLGIFYGIYECVLDICSYMRSQREEAQEPASQA